VTYELTARLRGWRIVDAHLCGQEAAEEQRGAAEEEAGRSVLLRPAGADPQLHQVLEAAVSRRSQQAQEGAEGLAEDLGPAPAPASAIPAAGTTHSHRHLPPLVLPLQTVSPAAPSLPVADVPLGCT